MGYDKVWKIKKIMVFQRKYGQQTKKNNGISQELWMIKNKMGLGGIMEDKKIFSITQIMEDLVNKQKK